MNETIELQELEGTEKQIAWADEIRRNTIQNTENLAKAWSNGETELCYRLIEQSMIRAFNSPNSKSASFIIDHRFSEGFNPEETLMRAERMAREKGVKTSDLLKELFKL